MTDAAIFEEKIMMRLFFVFLQLCYLSCLIGQDNSSAKAQDYQLEANQLIHDAIEKKECMGIAAGFAVGDQQLWSNGAGFSNHEQKTPFLASTLNRTASISKPMTAIAIMQLYEQGMIKLDEPIQTYLSNFPVKAEGQITVRHLLSHASGIGAYENKKERENTKNYSSLEDAIQIFKDRPLLNAPGTSFNYTSYGYTVLGLIIEKVSGKSYEDFLRENIWEKAGMTNTGIEYFGKTYPGKSELYHQHKKGKIKPGKITNLSDRVPGGGIYSTVEDILKFGQAILNNSLIEQSTLELMTTDSGLKKEGSGYGFGWYLYGNNPNYGPVFGHTGAQTGCSAMFMLLPEEQTTIIVLSNTSGAMQAVSNIAVQLFGVAAKAKEKP